MRLVAFLVVWLGGCQTVERYDVVLNHPAEVRALTVACLGVGEAPATLSALVLKANVCAATAAGQGL